MHVGCSSRCRISDQAIIYIVFFSTSRPLILVSKFLGQQKYRSLKYKHVYIVLLTRFPQFLRDGNKVCRFYFSTMGRLVATLPCLKLQRSLHASSVIHFIFSIETSNAIFPRTSTTSLQQRYSVAPARFSTRQCSHAHLRHKQVFRLATIYNSNWLN